MPLLRNYHAKPVTAVTTIPVPRVHYLARRIPRPADGGSALVVPLVRRSSAFELRRGSTRKWGSRKKGEDQQRTDRSISMPPRGKFPGSIAAVTISPIGWRGTSRAAFRTFVTRAFACRRTPMTRTCCA
jgi:hypothetical protein